MKYIALVLVLSGWVNSLIADTFSGKYRAADPNEKGYVVVTSVDQFKWKVSAVGEDKSREDPPPMEVTLGTQEDIASFVIPFAAISQISCLVWFKSPLFCIVPTNTEFRLVDGIRGSSLESKTGYVMPFPTLAGVMTIDLVRLPN